MKAEYNFSKAERGKFYRPEASVKSPIYLEDRVQAFVTQRAEDIAECGCIRTLLVVLAAAI